MNIEVMKQRAAAHALTYVRDHMRIGLGTGSTAAYFITLLGQALREGTLHDVIGVPTSERTAALAQAAGIPLTTLDEIPHLNLAVDGADEVDPQLNLIKGRGHALVREKIVAVHADRFIVIVDTRKTVDKLGNQGPLPVEILPFGAKAHVRWLESLGCRAEWVLNPDGSPRRSDNGNFLVWCHFAGGIEHPEALERTLNDRPGIVGHGLFLHMAHVVIIGTSKGVEVKIP